MELKRVLPLVMILVFGASALPLAALAADEEPPATEDAPKPKPKKAKKKKKGYDYEKSKYKSYKVLTEPEGKTYKFDERGNPITKKAKKKPAKKKPKPKPDEDEIDGVAPLDDKEEKKDEDSESSEKDEPKPDKAEDSGSGEK